MTLFVCLAVSALIFVYILSSPHQYGFEVSQRRHLEQEKERLVLVLKEIELDWSLRNVSEQHYTESKAVFEKELFDVLTKLDSIDT